MNELKSAKLTWNEPNIFWGEMAPCDHLLQLYDDDATFLNSLESFVMSGLQAGDGVVIIATLQHREALHARLEARGVDVVQAQTEDQYIPLGAEETLAKFMVDGWPDDDLFEKVVYELLLRAKGKNRPSKSRPDRATNNRRVRAFGEMVAILWANGDYAATVRLEHLWHKLCHAKQFSLLCAYPKSGFTYHATASLKKICDAHTRFFMT